MLEIRSDAGLIRAHLEPALTKVHLGIIFLEGLVLLALSLLVLAPRVDRGPIRDLYFCALLYGIATLIHGAMMTPAAAVDGCCVKASLAAAPARTLTMPPDAEASPGADAVS